MTLHLLPLTLLLLSLTTLALLLHRALFAPLSKLPGPLHTLFSDLILMYHEFAGQRRVYIHELHRKYGPVVRLGPNEASFTAGEALREIYQSGGSGFDKTEFYDLFIQYGTRTTFSTLQKRGHDQMKRHIAGSYANTNIIHSSAFDGIQERVRAFMRHCEEARKEPYIDFYVYLHCFAMDCASLHLLHPYGTKSIEGRDIHLMREYSFGDTLRTKLSRYRFPTLTHYLSPLIQRSSSSQIAQYVTTACAQPDLDPHSLAHKLRSSPSANFLPIQVAAECMNHLAAGIDTTGDALCFLIYHLSLPASYAIQDKLIAELASSSSHTTDTTGTDNDTDTAGAGIDNLPYLDAVIREGLRCFPPIPMSQPRYVPEKGRVIGGYYVPEKTIVSCQAWSVHRLNDDVFERGEEFRPERWLGVDGKAGGVGGEMNKLFFSFSAGGRSCTGRHLAMIEMKCLLRELYSRYKTRIAPEMRGSMELYDQAISTRPFDQTCLLVLEPLRRV